MSALTYYKPNVVDLFSGAGGTGLGFFQAGFKLLGAIEIDPNSANTYAANLKVKTTLRNITDINPEEFLKPLGLLDSQLDVLVGCPPCQGFSRMRNGSGNGDPRNDLVLHYLDYVKEAKPKFAIFENVPGIIRTTHGKKYYRKLISGLRELGYYLTERLENAADYGVSQRRTRVVVIGSYKKKITIKPTKTHSPPNSEEV